MRTRQVSLPELGMIAGTRAALGAGVGLLIADRFSPETRRAVGWTLFAVGVISTIPLVAEVVLREGRDGSETHGDGGSQPRRESAATV
ncbi:MAG: hypothetical protein HYR85_01320 [Planctomycetes bacterium]|nr:hypothetical protein [Planctomycetota bacterium]